MHNDKDDIEQLFSKKFEKYEAGSSEQEWLDLSVKLSKVNFLKFSFVSFNIYYLAVIITLAGTTAYSGFKNHQLSRKVHQLESSIQSIQQEKQLNSTTDKPVNSLEIKKLNDVAITDDARKDKTAATVAKSKIEIEDKPMAKKDASIRGKSTDDFRPQINEAKAESPTKQNAEIEQNKKETVSNEMSDSISETKIKKIVKKTLVIKHKSVIVKDTVIVTKTIK
jgi:hypothetical protein